MSWLIVAKMPLLISSRMTSAGLTPEQLGELLDGDRRGQLDRATLPRIGDLDGRLADEGSVCGESSCDQQ